jgi:hypothetical protein
VGASKYTCFQGTILLNIYSVLESIQARRLEKELLFHDSLWEDEHVASTLLPISTEHQRRWNVLKIWLTHTSEVRTSYNLKSSLSNPVKTLSTLRVAFRTDFLTFYKLYLILFLVLYWKILICFAHSVHGPPLWSSGQSSWLQIQRSRVRFPALPDLLRSCGSVTGARQPR